MLENLKILNGDLELKYNEYTYEYTVTVEDDVTSLEFEYKLLPECNVLIRDNILDSKENTVYLDVYDVNHEITYTFHVTKESSNTVSMIDNYKKSLEVKSNKNIEIYQVQLLSCGLFLILVIVFSLLFKRKKSNNLSKN